MGLPHKAKDFGMSILAENDNLRMRIIIILLLDAPLQLQHHWTGGVDDLNVMTFSQFIGLWRFAMRSQQHFHVVKSGEVVVIDGHQT